MKRYSLFLVLLLLFNFSCKKSNTENVDPRDQYVGRYDIAYTSSTNIGTFVYVEKETGTGTLDITKGDGANDLKFKMVWGQVVDNMDVRLDGSKFTILRQKDKLVIRDKSYDADYAGSGEFKGVNMSINAITQTTSSDGSKLVKTMIYNAVKK